VRLLIFLTPKAPSFQEGVGEVATSTDLASFPARMKYSPRAGCIHPSRKTLGRPWEANFATYPTRPLSWRKGGTEIEKIDRLRLWKRI